MKLYHNPRCSKSRQAKQILEKKGIRFETILYLENGLTKKEVESLASLLGKDVIEFIRTKEALFKENDLKGADNRKLTSALVKFPKLLERPIFINGKKAVVARPPELVLDIL